jgi:NhaP-type Na+/H+ and K+/H+ antiporter
LKASQIIQAKYDELGKDSNKIMFGLSQLVQKQDAQILQEGDTVLVVIRMGNNQSQVDLFTQENPLQVTKAINEFVKKLKSSGITTIYGTKDEQLTKILKYLDLNVESSDNPKYLWMAQL